jgi:predicted RNA-binding Zn-ribbon protein involved in translation (DUF1610 family)
MSDDFNYGHNASYAGEGGGVDDFLKTRTRGSFDSHVLNEKHLKDAGEDGLTVVLMAKKVDSKRFFYNLRWVYPWVKRIEATNKDAGGVKEWRVWMNPLNSYDGSNVHLDQKKRRRGERVVPPNDAFGKFSECVYQAVYDGEIDWLEPIVEFKSAKLDETRLFRAGAFFGAYGEMNLSKEKVAEMVKVGITPREAWKFELLAKPRFAFYVAHEGEARILDVHDGIGAKIKAAIEAAMKDYGQRGNPIANPYPVRVVHHKNRAGSDKNEVRTLIGAPLSSDDEDVIRGEVADDADLLALYDVDRVRAEIEAHACSRKLVLPWLDRSFPASSSASKAAPAQSAGGETYECPHCKKATLRDGVNVCSACGMEVDDDFAFVSRPCVECGTQVKVGADGEEVSCPKCGAVHRQDPSSDPDDDVPAWTLVRKGEAKVEEPADLPAPKAARARRRHAGSAQ